MNTISKIGDAIKVNKIDEHVFITNVDPIAASAWEKSLKDDWSFTLPIKHGIVTRIGTNVVGVVSFTILYKNTDSCYSIYQMIGEVV